MVDPNNLSKSMQEILRSSYSHRIEMLFRMVSDCEFYLHMGNRHPKYLWAQDVKTHIQNMVALWESIPDGQKPAGVTLAQIESYGARMDKTLLFSEVTVTSSDQEITFRIGGIPSCEDDLSGTDLFDAFLEELSAEAEVSVHVEAYTFGDGETHSASEEELNDIAMIELLVPDLIPTRCDNIQDLDFTFIH